MRSSSKVIKAETVKITQEHSLHALAGDGKAGEAVRKPAITQGDQPSAEKDEKVTSIRQEAYDLGMTEGVKRGAAQQRQDFAKHAKVLTGLIEGLTREKKEFFARMEEEALNLAFAIAEKILNHQIETDRDTICHVLTGALKKIVNRDGIRIHVHPDDYRHLTAGTAGIFPGLEGVKEAMLEADAAVGRGGALIESTFGEVDARLEQQLSELKAALSGQ